jgi:hypothetical protein
MCCASRPRTRQGFRRRPSFSREIRKTPPRGGVFVYIDGRSTRWAGRRSGAQDASTDNVWVQSYPTLRKLTR